MRFHVKLQKAEEGWEGGGGLRRRRRVGMHLHGKRPVFEEELVLLSQQLAVGAVTAKWKQKGFRANKKGI